MAVDALVQHAPNSTHSFPHPSHLLGPSSIGRPPYYPVYRTPYGENPILWNVEPLSETALALQHPQKVAQVYQHCLDIAYASEGSRNIPSKDIICDTFSYILKIHPLSGRILQATDAKQNSYCRLLPLTYENSTKQEEGTYLHLAEKAMQLYPDDPKISGLAQRILKERTPQLDSNDCILRDFTGDPALPKWMQSYLFPPSSYLLGNYSIGRPIHYPNIHKDNAKNISARDWIVRPLSESIRKEQYPKRISQIYENCLKIAQGFESLSKEDIQDTFSYILRISPLTIRSTGPSLWVVHWNEGERLCSYRHLLPLSYENPLQKEEGTYVDLAKKVLELYPDDPEISTLAHRILRERMPQEDAHGQLLRDSKGYLALPRWMRRQMATYNPAQDLSFH